MLRIHALLAVGTNLCLKGLFMLLYFKLILRFFLILEVFSLSYIPNPGSHRRDL